MGFTKTTYTLTVNKLVGDGNGGCWWVSRDPADSYVYKFGYFENGIGVVEQVSPVDGFDTFWDLVSWMISNNKTLPPTDLKAKVDRIGHRAGILPEFRGPAITNQNLSLIHTTFGGIEFSKKLGAFTIARRFYVMGHITWPDLSDIYIYMGQNNKIAKGRVNSSMNWLVDNQHLTEAQRTQFWLDWDAQVGN